MNVHVYKVEEWLKIRIKKRKLRLSSGHKQAFLINYFVRTDGPRYLGTKQENICFSKVTQYRG